MEIKKCENRKEWDEWLLTHNQAEFLQSWEWGEFQKGAGNEVIRWQMIEDGVVQGQVQGFVRDLKFGKYLYVSRVRSSEFGVRSLSEYLKKEKFIFLRLEPLEKLPVTSYQLPVTPNRQPQHTLILDLSKTEDELLSQMHSKTRYNIRLAERKGVEIKQEKDIEVFWKLNEETTGRDNFKSHDKEYYKKMLQNNFCHQLTAYHDRKPIASNIFIHFGKRFTYLHGTSSNEHRNLMAPYLLQWKGIELAKRLDCTEYDFWGIAPDSKSEKAKTSFHNFNWDVNHKWTGITRFKTGFGGTRKDYPEAVDVVFNKMKYKLYKLAKKFL